MQAAVPANNFFSASSSSLSAYSFINFSFGAWRISLHPSAWCTRNLALRLQAEAPAPIHAKHLPRGAALIRIDAPATFVIHAVSFDSRLPGYQGMTIR